MTKRSMFIPGVHDNHKGFDEVDISTLLEIAMEDTAVVEVDGDIPQLKAVIEDLDMYKKYGIIFNRLTCAASTVEQGADCCSVFKSIKTETTAYCLKFARKSMSDEAQG